MKKGNKTSQDRSTNLSYQNREKLIDICERLKNENNDIQRIKDINEIISKLRKLEKYGLSFEEHTEPVKEMLKTHIPVFDKKENRKYEEIVFDKNKPYNFLLEGDNLHSLILLNRAKIKVDVIYIDPPYNTGNKDFIYADAIVDSDDAYRHSKWLSFMNERLLLAKELLAVNGVIFISIDDNEQANLKLLCDEVFGEDNFICNGIRKNKAGSAHDSKMLAIEYEYYLVYAKNKTKVIFNKQTVNVEEDKKYKFKDEYVDRRGKYYLRDLQYKSSKGIASSWTITCPDGIEMKSDDNGKIGHEWRWGQKKVQWGIENGFIVFKRENDSWKIYIKQYQYVDNNDNLYDRKIPYNAFQTFLNTEGTQELNKCVKQNVFSYPKPISFIKFLLSLINNKEALVLDFFAGSGTTGQAVMELNAEDGGNRRFILCTNNENNICEKVTYQRLSNVIFGYEKKKYRQTNKTENLDTCKKEMIQILRILEKPFITGKMGFLGKRLSILECLNKSYYDKGTLPDYDSIEEELEGLGYSIKKLETLESVSIDFYINFMKFVLNNLYYKPINMNEFLVYSENINDTIKKLKEKIQEYLSNHNLEYENKNKQIEIKGKDISFVDGLQNNLKYYKTLFISKEDDDLEGKLLECSKYLIELENGIDLSDKRVHIVYSDDAMDELMDSWDDNIEQVYIVEDVMLKEEQEEFLRNKGMELKYIPNYYFGEEVGR